QGLQAFVSIDRDTSGRLGVTPAAIDIALYNAFGQRLISTIFTQSSQYRVVLEVKPEFRRGPDALKDIYVASSSGAQVPLSAIMRSDFGLDAERKDGMSPRAAIYHACLLRFRPILMTTLSALLGALPLALGTGAGSELRHPLGITMVGGLILSQALTLFSTPVIYLWFDRLARRLGGQGAAGASVKPVENGRP